MRKAIFCIFLLIFFYAVSGESATVYLKDGAVIENVNYYERVDGKLRLSIFGGILEVPEADILRIEDKPVKEKPMPTEPVVTKTAPPVESEKTDEWKKQLKANILEIEKRLGEIKVKEDELQKSEKEYNDVRLRIEVLFQSGRQRALKDGKDFSQWLNYLTTQERQWVQMNMMKKRKLEEEMEKLKKELEPLLQEKELLLEEKKSIEEKLMGM